MPAETWLDLAFEEAVAYLRDKKPTPRATFDAMDSAAQDRAFTVARVGKLDLLQGVLDDLTAALENGLTLREFLDENSDLGLSDGHLETVYRTNIQSAFGAGRYQQMTDPLIGAAVWGWRYKTVEDDRVRPTHAALDNLVFKLGEHDEVFPPWGFNCRCNSEIITAREARLGGYTSDALPEEVVTELATTNFRSPSLGQLYRVNLGDYDLGLVSHFLNDMAAKGGIQ